MRGKIFLVGDDIDTDQLAPGHFMLGGIEKLARHCLASSYPNFSKKVKPGDILVAGNNFGIGSSREQAAEALKFLGIVAVIAVSFGGIFYRNAINIGLPVINSKNLSMVRDGDWGTLNIQDEKLLLEKSNTMVKLEPIPNYLQGILFDGGLVPHLKKRFKK